MTDITNKEQEYQTYSRGSIKAVSRECEKLLRKLLFIVSRGKEEKYNMEIEGNIVAIYFASTAAQAEIWDYVANAYNTAHAESCDDMSTFPQYEDSKGIIYIPLSEYVTIFNTAIAQCKEQYKEWATRDAKQINKIINKAKNSNIRYDDSCSDANIISPPEELPNANVAKGA